MMNRLRIISFYILIFAGITFAQNSASASLENSVIIFIHGDGDYLFHNKQGETLSADEVILSKALTAAEKLNNAEVFIFHQKKRDNSFLFFPKNNLEMYCYRNGRQIEQVSTQRHNFNFSDEINFFRKYSLASRNRTLLYYGHEIPVTGGNNYNVSYKEQAFNLSVFMYAVKEFTLDKKLNLIILSTCGNGSPIVVKELAPYTDYIIASPDDLHLSYMNPLNLKKLNYYSGLNYEDFVVDFASSSFRELRKNVETITVISAYKTSMLSERFLERAAEYSSESNDPSEICDCTDIPSFNPKEASNGVIVFYNPPSFGKDKSKLEHSGWGCRQSANGETVSELGDLIESEHAGSE